MVATVLPLYLVRHARLHAAAVRHHRRPLPGRRRLRAPRRRLPRRPATQAQGRRHRRLRPVGGLQARAGGGRQRVRRDQRDHRLRPRRQGHAHRAARRDDLDVLAPRRTSGLRSASTARSTRPARCSARSSPSALLALAPGAFDSLFLVSFCFAAAGFGVIVLLVREPAARAPAGGAQGAGAPARRLRAPARPRASAALFVAAAALGLATASDGFIYLLLQRPARPRPMLFPLLVTGTAADLHAARRAASGGSRTAIGRGRVMLGGYVLLLGVYVTLLGPSTGIAGLFVALFMLGAYYAATDGVLMAMGSGHWSRGRCAAAGSRCSARRVSISRLVASIAVRRAVDAGGHPGRARRLRRRARGRDAARRPSPCGAPGHAWPACSPSSRSAWPASGRRRRRRRRRGAAHRATSSVRPSARRPRSGRPSRACSPQGDPFVLFRDLDRDDAANYGRLALAPLEGGRPGAAAARRRDVRARRLRRRPRPLPRHPRIRPASRPRSSTGSCERSAPSSSPASPAAPACRPTAARAAVTSFVDRPLLRRRRPVLDRGDDHRPRARQEVRRPREGLHDHARRQARHGARPQLLGDDVLARRRHVLRDDGHRRQDVADQGQPPAAAPAHAIHENVECPSLSPDETRIGYKKAVGHDPPVWRFHVLDLATGRETPLAEQRAARRPDRVARRRPCPLSLRRVDVDDAARTAAGKPRALAGGRRFARRRARVKRV